MHVSNSASVKIFFGEKRPKERVRWNAGAAERREVAVMSVLRTFYLGKFSGLDLGHEDHEDTNILTFQQFQSISYLRNFNQYICIFYILHSKLGNMPEPKVRSSDSLTCFPVH